MGRPRTNVKGFHQKFDCDVCYARGWAPKECAILVKWSGEPILGRKVANLLPDETQEKSLNLGASSVKH